MTEHDRAEEAFRRALGERAESQDFAPLDPARFTGSPDAVGHVADLPDADIPDGSGREARRRRRPWMVAVAAIVVLVIAAPVVSLVLQRPLGQGVRAGAPAAPAERGQFDQLAPGAPLPGTRRVSFLDVVLDVPADWGYGRALGTDWCVGERREPMPFVDVNPLSRAVEAVGCPGPVPDERQTPHVTWQRRAGADVATTRTVGAWRYVSRPIGSATVTVVVPDSEEALAARILDSARVVPVDHLGCPVARGGERPTTGAVTDLSGPGGTVVCQYMGVEGVNLAGSYLLEPDAARSLLASVQAAPVGEPLPLTSRICSAEAGSTLVVRFDGGRREVQVVVNGCGPLALDDGVEFRIPSRATCGDLFTGPLGVDGSDGPEVAAGCSPR